VVVIPEVNSMAAGSRHGGARQFIDLHFLISQ